MKKFGWLLAATLCVALLLCGCGSASQSAAPAYASVADLNAQAQSLLDGGDYAAALIQFSEAMRQNPLDLDAAIGSARCQLGLENFDLAAANLAAALQIDPSDLRVYDLYLETADQSGNLDYAREAVSQAERNGVEEFLARVPATPEADLPSGRYDEPVELTLTAPDGADVFVTESRNGRSWSYRYYEPIPLSRGATELEVYSLKDGIPGRAQTYTYSCSYPETEVQFSDPLVEQMVRTYLDRPTGPVTDADCETLTELSVYDYRSMAGITWEDYEALQIQTLEDFFLFPNLQTLELHHVADGADYSPLQTCRRFLSQLTIYDSGLSDLSFLEGFSNLAYASLYGNQITDLTPLMRCEHLTSLSVYGNPLDDLSVLKDFDLYLLGCSVQEQSDLNMLRSFAHLSDLTLFNLAGLDVSVLGELTGLDTLELRVYDYDSNYYIARGGESLKDVSFLSSLKNLQGLYIYELDSYDQAEVFQSLTNLKTLLFYPKTYRNMPVDQKAELQASLPGCNIYTW